MSNNTSVLCTYEGDGKFRAVTPAWERRADANYVIGERYLVEAQEQRSAASHNHFFACVQAAWHSLPPCIVERFRSPDHLRRYALIKSGYCDQREFACRSVAEANRLAAFIEPMDSYAVVSVSNAVVTVFTAKSQSLRAMGNKEFQKSKDAVLNVIAEMIGTTVDMLAKTAQDAA